MDPLAEPDPAEPTVCAKNRGWWNRRESVRLLVADEYTFRVPTTLSPVGALIEVDLRDRFDSDVACAALIEVGEGDPGGARAGARRGATVGSPRWVRICSIEERSVRKAMSRTRRPISSGARAS
jgi:hypothetical protein